MGIIGDLKSYSEFQAAEAMKAAAENPSGGASEGVGMGMGFAIANKMGETLSVSKPTNATASPPPLPEKNQYFVAINGQQSGPVNLSDLEDSIKSGKVSRNTLVWNQNLVEWTPAGKVSELVSHFPMIPPPLPTKNNSD